MPTLMLRGERHTGTKYLDAIVQYSFWRAPKHQRAVTALAAPLRARVDPQAGLATTQMLCSFIAAKAAASAAEAAASAA